MSILIQPSSSINRDVMKRICLISDVTACSGHVESVAARPARESSPVGRLATQEGVTMETEALSGWPV